MMPEYHLLNKHLKRESTSYFLRQSYFTQSSVCSLGAVGEEILQYLKIDFYDL